MSMEADLTLGSKTAVHVRAQAAPGARADRPPGALTAAELSSREAIVGIRGAWQRLEEVSEGSAAFQAFDLCLAWLDHYVFCPSPTHRAQVLSFTDPQGTLVAIAPLARRISGLMSLCEWIGEPLVQYGDILMDPGCDRQALRKALGKALADMQTSGLHLRNVRGDARIGEVVDFTRAQLGEVRQAAIIELADFASPDEYFATFKKRSRQNRRKKRRALERLGALSFTIVPAGPRARALCRTALDWKRAWLAERGLSSRAFQDERALKVLEAAISVESSRNPLHLLVQAVDGTPLAIEIAFITPQGNASFLGAYDPQYEDLSPGKVQMEEAVRHGFAAGWPSYDLLAPMSAYKESWSTRTVPVADYLIPAGLGGLAYRDAYLRTLRPAARAAFDRLPASVRNWLLQLARS